MRTVLYASPFNHSVSGADESLLTLLRFLPVEEWRPIIVVPFRSAYIRRYRDLGIKVFRFPLFRILRTFNPFYWIFFTAWFPIEVGYFLFRILRERPSLVHSNMDSFISPLVAARIAGIPTVLHYRAKTIDEPNWFFNSFLPLLVRLSDRIVAISHATARPFFTRELEAKVRVCYNAVDLRRFQEVARKRLSELPPELSSRRIALFVGRLDPQKRLEDMISAARQVIDIRRDVVFVIAGGDMNIALEREHKRALENQIKLLGLDSYFHFLGRRSDIPEIMASADCFVFPAENEGFGRAVIEAMASGVPVIVANSGAPPELLENGELGTVVPLRDPSSLGSAIVKVLESSSAREVAQKAKRVAFERFGAESHAVAIASIYRELASYPEANQSKVSQKQ